MTVEDIMTKNVVSVSADTKITEVAEILFKNRFHGMPVLENGQLVGIITEKDFFTRDSANLFLPSYISFLKENRTLGNLSKEQKENVEKLFNSEARDIMSRDCVPILKNMDVKDLLEFFRTTKFSTLPVIDERNALVGIVTLSDILNLIKI
jgi:acetoin utilization protein AcuB